jgi:hypothetical protein
LKRLLPFVVLILLLLAGIISVPFLLRPESHRTEITDALSKLLKRPVIIGTISMSYWPPTLHLGQIAVMKEDGSPILQIESAAAPLDVPSLFHLQFLPNAFQATHWVLTTQRKVDGRWDLEDWFSSTSRSLDGKTWPLRQITWKEGEIHAVDPYAAVSQELVLGSIEGGLDLKQDTIKTTGAFTGLGAPASFSLSAMGQFFSNPKWSGDLQLMDQANSAAFHLDQQGEVLDVKGGSSRWGLSNGLAFIRFYGRGMVDTGAAPSSLTLDNWQFHAHRDAGRLTFEQTADVSGGQSEIKGLVETPSGSPLAHIDIALKDIPAEAVFSAAGENIPLTGKVTALAKDFELTLSSRTSSTFKGQGVIELKDGRYQVPTVSLKKLAKAKTLPYVRKKFPDLEQNGFPVTKLSAHWQAKEGLFTVADGLLVSKDIKVGWVGKFDAARQGLDGYVRIQIREKDPKLARLIPVKYRSQPANGRLQGSWQEWTLRAIPASKIPTAIQSKLRQALR